MSLVKWQYSGGVSSHQQAQGCSAAAGGLGNPMSKAPLFVRGTYVIHVTLPLQSLWLPKKRALSEVNSAASNNLFCWSVSKAAFIWNTAPKFSANNRTRTSCNTSPCAYTGGIHQGRRQGSLWEGRRMVRRALWRRWSAQSSGHGQSGVPWLCWPLWEQLELYNCRECE